MFTLYARRLLATCVAMLAISIVSGCSSESAPFEPKPKDTTAVVPWVVSLDVELAPTLILGMPTPYKITARFSSGPPEDVTSKVQLVSSDASVTVASGSVIGRSPGEAMLSAVYQGVSDQVRVVTTFPTPTPRSQLPAMSDSVWNYIKSNLSSNGSLMRFGDTIPGRDTARVWYQSSFDRAEVEAGIAIVRQVLSKGVSAPTFVIVADSSTAQFHLVVNMAIGNNTEKTGCALGGIGSFNERFQILSGSTQFLPECQTRWVIAHEMLHALGFGNHTEGNVDVMGVSAFPRISPLIMSIGEALYGRIPAGTRPID